MFDRHANLKYKFRNGKFWAEGYYVSTVGLNEATIAKYIREQEQADIALDRPSVKEYENPFKKWPGTARLTGTPRVKQPSGLNEAKPRDLSPWPALQGYTLRANHPLCGW